MFINHEKIPHRRIMNSNSSPGNIANPQLMNSDSYKNGNLQSSQFVRQPNLRKNDLGYERVMLAQFVMSELNQQHKNDAQILNKFRREAQQAKKRKYHAKRVQQPRVQLSEPKKMMKMQQSRPRIPSSPKLLQQPPSTPQRIIVVKQPQGSLYEQKILNQNAKLKRKIRHKDEVLKKAQYQLKKASKRLHYLQQQLQQQKYEKHQKQLNKITDLFQNISSKVQQNGVILNSSLFKLHQLKDKQFVDQKIYDFPTPIYSRKKKAVSEQQFDRLTKAPSIKYSGLQTLQSQNNSNSNKNKYSYHSERTILLQTDQLQRLRKAKNELESLQSSRHRMQRITGQH